jgi:hypothetical protein
MFNVIISSNGTAWETDQLMRMFTERFNQSGGVEAQSISLDTPETLKLLEKIPTLLLYERATESPSADIVRYGYLHDITNAGTKLTFRFAEEGRFPRAVLDEFADRLDMERFEQNRTHWAVKDGAIPTAMLDRLLPSYDVVFSFAGENRDYVEQVAAYLSALGVKIFYDHYEEVNLWGKHLVEHFDFVYRRSGKYCVMFISQPYVEKMWTRLERRSALVRAMEERKEYILPARFDEAEVPGILADVHYIPLGKKSPVELGEMILRKLGRPIP